MCEGRYPAHVGRYAPSRLARRPRPARHHAAAALTRAPMGADRRRCAHARPAQDRGQRYRWEAVHRLHRQPTRDGAVSYLARLLATPEPAPPPERDFRDVGGGASLKSLKRAGKGAFDPFETSPPARIPDFTLPADWRDGLARLATMPPPPSLARRWERIVADALMLGERWASQALALGWRDVDLWGCDPEGSRRLDRDGLAMLLHGRAMRAMTERSATVATPGGRTLSYYRAPLHGAVPLWAILPAITEDRPRKCDERSGASVRPRLPAIAPSRALNGGTIGGT